MFVYAVSCWEMEEVEEREREGGRREGEVIIFIFFGGEREKRRGDGRKSERVQRYKKAREEYNERQTIKGEDSTKKTTTTNKEERNRARPRLAFCLCSRKIGVTLAVWEGGRVGLIFEWPRSRYSK